MRELDKVHRFGIVGAGTIGAFHAAAIAMLPAAQLGPMALRRLLSRVGPEV
jgi:predicted dehydrogenase